jgi:hypothetical protein
MAVSRDGVVECSNEGGVPVLLLLLMLSPTATAAAAQLVAASVAASSNRPAAPICFRFIMGADVVDPSPPPVGGDFWLLWLGDKVGEIELGVDDMELSSELSCRTWREEEGAAAVAVAAVSRLGTLGNEPVRGGAVGRIAGLNAAGVTLGLTRFDVRGETPCPGINTAGGNTAKAEADEEQNSRRNDVLGSACTIADGRLAEPAL